MSYSPWILRIISSYGRRWKGAGMTVCVEMARVLTYASLNILCRLWHWKSNAKYLCLSAIEG